MKAFDHERLWHELTTSFTPWFEDLKRNKDYSNGIQWSAKDRKFMDHYKRLSVTWNITTPKVDAYVGAAVANRRGVRAEAQDPGDRETQRIINAVFEQDYIETSAEAVWSQVAKNQAIFRIGWVQSSWERDFKGKFKADGHYVLRALNPMDVLFDPWTTDMDFDESEFIMYHRMYTYDQIISKFVKDDEMAKEIEERAVQYEGLEAIEKKKHSRSWANRGVSDTAFMKSDTNRTTNTKTGSGGWIDPRFLDLVDIPNGRYRVMELHERREIDVKYIFNPRNGRTHRVPDSKYKDTEFIADAMEKLGLSGGLGSVIQGRERQMWISASSPGLHNDLLFERPYTVQGHGYSIKGAPYKNYGNTRQDIRGLVDFAIDSQDVRNHALASRAHLINSYLNPRLFVVRGAYDDKETLAKLQDRSYNNIVPLDGPPRESIYPDVPDAALAQILTSIGLDASAQSEESTTISKNMLGMRENAEESGRLIQVKNAATEAALTEPLENLQKIQLAEGKFHLGTIQTHMTWPRMVRISTRGGEEEYEKVMINAFDEEAYLNGEVSPEVRNVLRAKNDITQGTFDIYLDNTKYTKTERAMMFDKIFQIMQIFSPGAREVMFPHIIDLMDIPNANELIRSLKQYLRMTVTPQKLMSEIQINELIKQLVQSEQSGDLSYKILGMIRDLPPEKQDMYMRKFGEIVQMPDQTMVQQELTTLFNQIRDDYEDQMGSFSGPGGSV